MNSELILAALKYTPEEAYNLAKEKGERMPEVEAVIATDPEWACWYAIDVIKDRWPEAETVISTTDPYWAYRYAKDVIKGRWPEAETVIVTNLLWAYRYARDVIKGRWPEVEAVIATDPWYKEQYEKEFNVKL